MMVHRLWQTVGRPLPSWLAWLLTFLFVNCAWVFFRANSLEAAERVLGGMIDVSSVLPEPGEMAPTSDLAWAGFLADSLLKLMPAALIGQLPALSLLVVGTVILAQRNTADLASGRMTAGHLWFGCLLLTVGLQMTFVQTSTIFLYFNF